VGHLRLGAQDKRPAFHGANFGIFRQLERQSCAGRGPRPLSRSNDRSTLLATGLRVVLIPLFPVFIQPDLGSNSLVFGVVLLVMVCS